MLEFQSLDVFGGFVSLYICSKASLIQLTSARKFRGFIGRNFACLIGSFDSYLCFPMFQIPKFHVPISHSYKIASILRKRYSFHLCTDFVTGDFDVILPVPHIDYHVVLCTDTDYIVGSWRKRLQ